MIKRAYSLAQEIRLHIEKIGTDCNVAINSEAISRLIARELVKAQEEGIAAEREAIAVRAEDIAKSFERASELSSPQAAAVQVALAQSYWDFASAIRSRSPQDAPGRAEEVST
jgi:hypothetical protein